MQGLPPAGVRMLLLRDYLTYPDLETSISCKAGAIYRDIAVEGQDRTGHEGNMGI